MPNGKGQVELARERLVKAVNQVLGVVRRNGRSRKVGLALVLMVLVGGRASVRNAAETFGLERELMGRWENLEMRGDPFRLVKGQVAVIVDDTVTARLREDVSPRELLDLPPHPREVREGQAPHDRDSGPQAGRSRFSPRLEEDVGFVWINEFKTKIDVARCWTCSRSPSACPGSSSTPVLAREARDGQRGVKAQVQPNSGSAQGTLEEGYLPVGYPWSLLRRPDPGRPSDYSEVARPGM